MKRLMYTSDHASIFIHLPGMFLSTDILFEQRIGQFAMDLFYIRFTYYIKDNQQECSRLSNWFADSPFDVWVADEPLPSCMVVLF